MKVFYAAIAAFLCLSLVSCMPSKEKMKEQFVTSCMNEIGTDMAPEVKAMMKDYCECSGEKVVNKFSNKEIAAFNKMSKAELQAKLMPAIQDCLNELKVRMQTYQTASAAAPAQ